MEDLFKVRLKEDRAVENRLGTALSYRQYYVLVSKVLAAKLNKSHKLISDHQLLEKYEVIEEGTSKRLVVPDSNPHVYYVHDDELFPLLMEAHMDTDHGSRNQMMNHLRKKYKNIPYQDVLIFLSLCEDCVQKERSCNEKDKRMAQFNQQCSIDLIDYQVSADGEYKFILVYTQLFTKFVMLKPLKSKRPQEVADNLIDIFGILAPPALLQSSCRPKFLTDVIDILKILWPSLNIASMKCEDLKDSTAQEIDDMVTSWMRYNNRLRWSEGIRFVQLKNNTKFHAEIGMTPYEALFKRSVRVVGGNDEDEAVKSDDENSVEVKEEVMDICKTEMKSSCGNCGKGVEDEECAFCKSGFGETLSY